METTIQANWDDEIINAIQASPRMQQRVKDRIRRGSFRLKANVQRRMPVDTGAAKASWGAEAAGAPAEAGDGIWEVEDDGYTITQGSRRSYIAQLNEGWSQQAPAGFLDAEHEAEVDTLEEEIASDVAEAFEK